MTELMWIKSHVERLLQDEWDVCRVIADDDGDYPFRYGAAGCWVTVLATDDAALVRVWAYAADGVKSSAKLLQELNAIQQRGLSSSVMWKSGHVIVSQTISPVGLTGAVLRQALTAVGGLADDIGVLIASMFGGTTPHEVVASKNEDAA
jgi:hypothetical protein